jgi:hypothetical protein
MQEQANNLFAAVGVFKLKEGSGGAETDVTKVTKFAAKPAIAHRAPTRHALTIAPMHRKGDRT